MGRWNSVLLGKLLAACLLTWTLLVIPWMLLGLSLISVTRLYDRTLRIIIKDKCHPACGCPHKCQKTAGLKTQTASMSQQRSESNASKHFSFPGFVLHINSVSKTSVGISPWQQGDLLDIMPYCVLRKGHDNIAIDSFVLPIKMPPSCRLRREVD